MWRKIRARVSGAQPAVTITTTSEYGVLREAVYCSAAELAAAIIKALDEIPEVRSELADVRVRESDGCLLLTSQLHMRRQRALGLLHCDACGIFCQGARGLRDHQHIKHVGNYEDALEAVAVAKGAIIKYTPSAGAAHLSELWAARAAEAERLKKHLPPSL